MNYRLNVFSLLLVAVAPLTACTRASLIDHTSAQTAYITSTAPGWQVTSLITVGESVNNKTDGTPYRMVGAPDGLGAYTNSEGNLVVLMNHELQGYAGAVRAHGATGAFVSKWVIDINTLKPIHGEDLINKVYTWNAATQNYTLDLHNQLSRLCSADLPVRSALYNANTGKGFDGHIFLNGEEENPHGRAFAHVVSGPNAGTSYELPALGKLAMENVLAHPSSGDRTIVAINNDVMPGMIYFYLGQKRKDGNEVSRAGLTGGKLYGVKSATSVENPSIGVHGAFTLEPVFGDGKSAGRTGIDLRADSYKRGITAFARPEDGVWDLKDRSVYYFATTDKFHGDSRLYKLKFTDIDEPTRGGLIEPVLNSREIGAHMFDNLTMSADGKLYIQEDPGIRSYLAAIWEYDPVSKKAVKIFVSDAARFAIGGSRFLTINEENSGIVDITALLKNARGFDTDRKYMLGTSQAHYSLGGELVQGGQLYLMSSPVASTLTIENRPHAK